MAAAPSSAPEPEVSLLPTTVGEARLSRFRVPGTRSEPRLRLALGHGAGGGIEAADLQALAAELPARGVEVILVEQPWRVAGRKIAPAPKTLDAAWTPLMAAITAEDPTVPLVTGGRSAGARVACRTAAETGAVGVLALAFPLHPPGKPANSRAAELALPGESGIPTLVLQGAADAFGHPDEFPAGPQLPPGVQVFGLPAGDHSFAVRKSQPSVLPELVEAAGQWLAGLAD
ncbi:alpha/beta family hydrolase [Streptacidiphilus monticola]|uniref:Alpha/beta family hydrolase n=1 Tax=Streptacidiphilus monticola TaxID=2161674 RepID=A0ABW1G6F8_9ACTN